MPIVYELKTAYDCSLENLDQEDEEIHNGEQNVYSEGEISENDEEPQAKKKKNSGLPAEEVTKSRDVINTKSGDVTDCDVNNASTSSIYTSPLTKCHNSQDFLSKYVNKKKKTGPPLNEDYAKWITDLLETGMEEEAKEDTIKNCLPPDNCQRLDLIRVNSEIFKNAKKDVKAEDVMLQRVQRPLIAGVNKLVLHMNKFIEAAKGEGEHPSPDQTMEVMAQAIALVADSSHELDVRRRAKFKVGLKPEYKSLCNDNAPVKTLLFGEELSDKIKDIKETNKIAYNVNSYPQNHNSSRHKQFSKPYSDARATRPWPFLGANPSHKPRMPNPKGDEATTETSPKQLRTS